MVARITAGTVQKNIFEDIYERYHTGFSIAADHERSRVDCDNSICFDTVIFESCICNEGVAMCCCENLRRAYINIHKDTPQIVQTR